MGSTPVATIRGAIETCFAAGFILWETTVVGVGKITVKDADELAITVKTIATKQI